MPGSSFYPARPERSEIRGNLLALELVMAGLGPAIHVFFLTNVVSVDAGTSPGMTERTTRIAPRSSEPQLAAAYSGRPAIRNGAINASRSCWRR
jgi:hypothetical protein